MNSDKVRLICFKRIEQCYSLNEGKAFSSSKNNWAIATTSFTAVFSLFFLSFSRDNIPHSLLNRPSGLCWMEMLNSATTIIREKCNVYNPRTSTFPLYQDAVLPRFFPERFKHRGQCVPFTNIRLLRKGKSNSFHCVRIILCWRLLFPALLWIPYSNCLSSSWAKSLCLETLNSISILYILSDGNNNYIPNSA